MRERNREIWEGKAEQRTIKRGDGKLRENVFQVEGIPYDQRGKKTRS